jgi:hypothetical protein
MKPQLLFTLRLGFVLALLLLATAGLGQAQELQPEGLLAPQAALGSAFTYQGQLKKNGSPINDTCDFQFSLYDASSGGTQITSTQTVTGVSVSNGLFTTLIDFGNGAFNGDARWLEIAVKCAGDANFVPLSQRQPLTAVPYALFSKAAAWSGLSGVPAGFADGVDNDTTYTAGIGLTLIGGQFGLDVPYSLPQSCANGQLPKWNGSAWACANDNDTTTFWSLSGNAATTPGTNFLGTTDNQALEFKVNNFRVLRLEPNAASPNIIGGFSGNSVTAGVKGATIGGGGESTGTNRVTDDYGTVGGGFNNQAGNGSGSTSDRNHATVGGGINNTASGYSATVGGGINNTASGYYATVGGGINNTASDSAATVGGGINNTASGSYATVGGGIDNTASGSYATVGGGYNNTASNFAATVGGGRDNTAAGDYSFVVGRRAKNNDTNHKGVFLFADSTDADFNSTLANEFAARANGGFRFVSSSGTCTTTGGGWSCTSDRNAKTNFAMVDARQVLLKVSGLPIQTWSFKDNTAIRHMGPMAQDFYAAFGLGQDDKTISTIDLDGVALASIQGLYHLLQEKDAEIAVLEKQVATLQSRNAAQQAQIDDLEARLAALEKRLGGTPSQASALPLYGSALGGLLLLGLLGYRRRKGGAL